MAIECMNPAECYARFDKAAKQISEIHAVVLGVDGQGGLHRQVQDHAETIDELQRERSRLIGIVAGVSAAVSAFAAWLMGK